MITMEEITLSFCDNDEMAICATPSPPRTKWQK